MAKSNKKRNGSNNNRKKVQNRDKEDIKFLQDRLENNQKAHDEYYAGKTKKNWTQHDMKSIKPQTPKQKEMFHSFFQPDTNICAYGSAGTGKTFVALTLAFGDMLSPKYPQNKIIIVRSAVASRDIGYLPGTEEEKAAAYEAPYRDMVEQLFGSPHAYDNMKEAGLIEFALTSNIRGVTWDNAFVIVDEVQNMNFHEIDSVMTRVGDDTRVMVLGDNRSQADLKNQKEREGIHQFLNVATRMRQFDLVKFTTDDIVRSEFVKDWIEITQEELHYT